MLPLIKNANTNIASLGEPIAAFVLSFQPLGDVGVINVKMHCVWEATGHTQYHVQMLVHYYKRYL